MTRKTGFPAATIELVLARSSGDCECMGRGCTLTAQHFHHRVLKGHGGSRRPEIQQPSACLHLCFICHDRIHGMPAWAMDNGFIVSRWADPLTVPVRWRQGPPVLLNDSGDVIPTTARRDVC